MPDRVRRPNGCKKLTEVPNAHESWDTDVREFAEAGGRPLSYDEKKMALINIVPDLICADMMIRLHMFPDQNPG